MTKNTEHLIWMMEARIIALDSPDPSRQVGCVLVKNDVIIAKACNTLPDGCEHLPERLERPEKYDWVEHAERNAIYSIAASELNTTGATIYVNWFPCIDCARAVMMTKMSRLVCYAPDLDHPRWADSFKAVLKLLDESDIEVIYLEEPTTPLSPL